MTNKYTSEHFSELLNDLCSACSMIGYATSGNERQNHRATKDKIKAEIIDAIAVLLRERESAKAVARLVVRDGRAAGWEFNAPMPNGTYDLYTAPKPEKE